MTIAPGPHSMSDFEEEGKRLSQSRSDAQLTAAMWIAAVENIVVSRADTKFPGIGHNVYCHVCGNNATRGHLSGCGWEAIKAALSEKALRCDECDPSFGCFDGSKPCSKQPHDKPNVAELLLEVARKAYYALEDSEERGEGVLVPSENAIELQAALDALEALPAAPGYASCGPNNAAHEIRSDPVAWMKDATHIVNAETYRHALHESVKSQYRPLYAAPSATERHFNPVTQVYFRAGLLACREYMARFVEAQDQTIAQSIRANWWPSLGEDFGPPRKLHWDELYEGEPPTGQVKKPTPTQEALPVALEFLEQVRP